MLDRQACLIGLLRGHLRDLEQCCTGANVHEIGNLRQVFRANLEILERWDLERSKLEELAERVRPQRARAAELYRTWIEIRAREGKGPV